LDASSSRCLTILGYVANLLAISALYSAWSIMVKFALVAQRLHCGYLPTSSCCLHSLLPCLLVVQSGSLTYGLCWFSSHK
ncbi:hypothetical protein Tco_0275019, partial [Tanacetum coccineum]